MKKFLRFCGLILLASVAGSCHRTAASKKLYWVQALKGHPVHQLTQIGFKEGSRSVGYEAVIVGTDEGDVAGTITLAEQAMAGGDVGGMAIWTGNPSYKRLIKKAADAGIPVILPHFPMKQEDAPGATGVISCDPAQYALAAADEIGNAIGGKGTVAVSQGSFNITENMVAETFAKRLAEKYPQVKVMQPIEEGFNQTDAISKAVLILQSNLDVVAVLSTTGGGPTTWSKAQRDVSRKIVIIGMDYTRVNLDLVKSGQVHALVGQPLWEESYGAAELLARAIKGEKFDYWTKLPAPLITADKLDPYYKIADKVDAANARK